LTLRQGQLLRYLAAEQACGRSPTFRQMAAALATPVGNTYRIYEGLMDRGGVERLAAMRPRAPDGAALRFVAIGAA
jgi:DNA-binding IclR family transcriptional regulator